MYKAKLLRQRHGYKRKKTNRRTVVHKTPLKNPETKQHEPFQKLVISGVTKGQADPVPHVASVVLHMLIKTH